MTDAQAPTPHDQLVTALYAVLDECDTTGWNLPEALARALVEVATEHGGSYALIAHRPGSWEAQHVAALAAEADHR